jgi:2-octaprenyl-6-methoxyphenol hydroxylase
MRQQALELVDAVVVGGGPAGLTAAMALASAGVETALIAMPVRPTDQRTTALLDGSVRALDALGVWTSCREQAAPLRRIRIVDDTARLLRGPEVCFAASEIDLDAFAFNIENRLLLAALEARARELQALRVIPDAAAAVANEGDRVQVRLAEGPPLASRLVVGADGRNSLCRAAAGIAMTGEQYPQAALVLNLRHDRDHGDTSTEFHTERGPFTLVPLPGRRSSLVLVAEPSEVARLAALDDVDLGAEIERRSHSILGRTVAEPGRGVFPLAVETAQRLAARRIALVGEAAHVIPPIGAQGLNLGLRDAATVAELAGEARAAGEDIGGDELTARYEYLRRADVMSRTIAVDLLNRSLLSDFLPVQAARGLGLFLMRQIGPLRRAVMREGVMPAASQPRLMRGETL